MGATYTHGVISGAELQTAREDAGLTRPELGSLVGVSARQVYNWEHEDEVSPSVLRRVSPVLWPSSATVDLGTMDDFALGAHMQAVVAEIMSRLADRPATREESHPTRQDDAENAPTGASDPESSHIVHPKQPTRQVGKRPPRPTPGPTPK